MWRAKHPDEAAFSGAYGRAVIAADTFDAIMAAAAAVSRSNGARVRDPKPYPRPGTQGDTQHFGSGGLPVSEFDAWYYAQE